jgi:hypothetical protein
VAVQLNVFTAEGIATANDRNEKISAEYGEMPATNRWCAHTRKAEHRDREAGEGDERVAEHVLAREAGDHLADHTHRRQDHDVDRGCE